jgi:hypothetical protein
VADRHVYMAANLGPTIIIIIIIIIIITEDSGLQG